MAALSDVENALVQLIAEILDLGSNYIPGSAVDSSVAQCACRVYRGWPKSSVLNSDLTNGVCTISVFPVSGSTRRTTRYLPQWTQMAAQTPTFSATVSGSTVTFAGTSSPIGQVAAIFVGTEGYPYRLLRNDTPATLCAALASLVPNSTASGAVLTVATNQAVSVVVACDITAAMETRRQEQNIWVTIWSATPPVRDVAAAAVDDGLANMQDQYGRLTYEIGLPDGSNCEIRYISSHTDDAPQQDNLWRRDLRYTISYPTLLTQIQTPLIVVGGTVNADYANTVFGTVKPPNPFSEDFSPDFD